jgi:hypothetical protein
MPCGVALHGSGLEFHSLQRKQLRRRQVARAMLVVNRERFDRLP